MHSCLHGFRVIYLNLPDLCNILNNKDKDANPLGTLHKSTKSKKCQYVSYDFTDSFFENRSVMCYFLGPTACAIPALPLETSEFLPPSFLACSSTGFSGVCFCHSPCGKHFLRGRSLKGSFDKACALTCRFLCPPPTLPTPFPFSLIFPKENHPRRLPA